MFFKYFSLPDTLVVNITNQSISHCILIALTQFLMILCNLPLPAHPHSRRETYSSCIYDILAIDFLGWNFREWTEWSTESQT